MSKVLREVEEHISTEELSTEELPIEDEDVRHGTVRISINFLTYDSADAGLLPRGEIYSAGFVNLLKNEKHGIPAGSSVSFNGLSSISEAIERVLGMAGIAVIPKPHAAGIWVAGRPRE